METSIALALVLSVAVASIGPAVTLFILFRFGLVGGSPRELLSLQMDTERAKLDVESRRLKIEEEMAALRARQLEIQVSLKEEELRNPRPQAPPRMVNPQAGLRSATSVPPPPSRSHVR